MNELEKYNNEGLLLLLQQCKNKEERSRLLYEGVVNQICLDFILWINARLNCNLTIGVENNQLKCATIIARSLRLLCTEPSFAEILRKHNFCECGLNLCYQFTLGSDVNHFEESPNCDQIKSLILTTYQILSNYCACGEDFASDYWINLIRLGAQRNVEICKYIQSNPSLAAFVASLYQCTHSPSSNSRRRLQILLTDRLLFSSLLLSIVEISSFKSQENSSCISSTNNRKEAVIEWLYILIHLFIKRGEIITLIQLLANKYSTVNHASPITDTLHFSEKCSLESASKSDMNAISTNGTTTTTTETKTNQNNIEILSNQNIRSNIILFSHEQLIILMLLQDYLEDTKNTELIVSLLDTTTITIEELDDLKPLPFEVMSSSSSLQDTPSSFGGNISNDDNDVSSRGSSSSSSSSSNSNNISSGDIDPKFEREFDDKASTQLLRLLLYLSHHISAVISATFSLVYMEGEGSTTPIATPTLTSFTSTDDIPPPSSCPDSLPLSLEVLGAALAVVPVIKGINFRTALTKMGLLTNVSVLIKYWGVTGLGKRKITTANGTKQTNNNTAEEVYAHDEEEERKHHCVRAALRLIYNLLHGCQYAQDQLREVGGLATILSNCTTDFSNPLAREWALLCTKHACDQNELNQEFIRSLTPQDVIQDEILKSHGVKLEIDPSGGTFKFSQEISK